mmetsp:Transcript_25619/g.82192  ORF Transcript_25619/g.82192 Transcript_25619/m.82192 type:complete len:227 (+) Transcript_25619:273-953(+)
MPRRRARSRRGGAARRTLHRAARNANLFPWPAAAAAAARAPRARPSGCARRDAPRSHAGTAPPSRGAARRRGRAAAVGRRSTCRRLPRAHARLACLWKRAGHSRLCLLLAAGRQELLRGRTPIRRGLRQDSRRLDQRVQAAAALGRLARLHPRARLIASPIAARRAGSSSSSERGERTTTRHDPACCRMHAGQPSRVCEYMYTTQELPRSASEAASPLVGEPWRAR